MMIMQTKAIFVDAYRELNAKKLFWLTMALNVLAVVLFASLGINENGFSFLHWKFDSPFMNTNFVSPKMFYTIQFTSWGVPIWLSWVTTILALISTAGIVPDMVSGGTIEPMLSKPIGRVRLFLTKYLTGLMFVGLQILVFSFGCLLVFGIRAGTWDIGLFMAVPIVLAFFSYLFSFCVLIGLLTRSTIAALLLTIIFWCMIFAANVGDQIMLAQREGAIIQIEDRRADVEAQERFATKRIEQLIEQDKVVPGIGDEPLPEGVADSMSAVNPALTLSRSRLEKVENSLPTWETWSERVFALKTVLPKTQETIGLLERHLITDDELKNLMNQGGASDRSANENEPAMADPRVPERVAEAMRSRTVGWVLGTSLIFETILLGLSTLIFVRRDF